MSEKITIYDSATGAILSHHTLRPGQDWHRGEVPLGTHYIDVETGEGREKTEMPASVDGNRVIGETQVAGFTNTWKTLTATLRASDTSSKAHLNLLLQGDGTIDIDLVSLYPKDTFQNRPNGLRADLVQLLKDMKPGFLRFDIPNALQAGFQPWWAEQCHTTLVMTRSKKESKKFLTQITHQRNLWKRNKCQPSLPGSPHSAPSFQAS